MFDKETYEKRIEWFTKARFGMFIHWGLYAIPARGEWVRSQEQISNEDYWPFFEEFNPISYDPREWAKLAKAAGMQYVVLTAKHHDGFCLFDSQYTDYKSTNTKCKKDLVGEYVEAVRAEGLKVGLYYSLLDWHHPDYPHYGDCFHPMRENIAFKDTLHNFDTYLTYMHNQVRELCTNYGQLDLLWFDFSYPQINGEQWRATELIRMIRKLQPTVIIDNRLEGSGDGFGSLVTQNPSEYAGDFVSPEQLIPPKGISDSFGNPVVWESCITMNNSWGYCENDLYFKSTPMLVRKLVECVSKGGNMLLNIGPDAKGNIPLASITRLKEIGEWLNRNGESIYGCTYSTLEKPEYGRITSKDNKLYYHIMDNPIGFVPLYGLKKEQIKKVRLVTSGAELKITDGLGTANYPEMAFIGLGPNPELPDAIDTVVEVTLKA